MVKAWEKYIEKSRYRKVLDVIIEDILNDNLSGYDIKEMKWYENYYRLRKWRIRIVFTKIDGNNMIKAVNERGNIYKWIHF